MLKLYILNKTASEMIYWNDAFFDSGIVHGKIKINQSVKDIMYKIDGLQYTRGLKGISKYGGYEIPLTSLSTGCKTLINICSNRDKIFYIGECGDNVLRRIFALKSGMIGVDNYFVAPKFRGKIEVYINNFVQYYMCDSIQLNNLLEKVFVGV